MYSNKVTSLGPDYGAFKELIIGLLVIFSIVSLILIVSNWRIYKKAGKPGWTSIIPIYNVIVLFEIAQIDIFKVILLFIPFVNIYIVFKLYIELAKNFGKKTSFGVLTVFFPIICLPILAFSKCSYSDEVEEEVQTSILDIDTNGVSEDKEFSYGYEKEATVVMDPVTEETKDIEPVTDTEQQK